MNIIDMQNTKQLAAKKSDADMAVAPGFGSLGGFELLQRQANLLASSGMVPDRYKGKLADCVIAMNMSNRMGADPLMTMQHLYIVHGTPAWSAQMMISVWNQCGRYTSIRYVFQGEQGRDDWGCKAMSMERETGEPIEGALVTIGMAKAEGWYGKKGSKWQTMPEQMLRYRSAAWLVRAYAPELAMGFQTIEEVHDTYDAVPGKDGSFSVADLRADTDSDSSGLRGAFENTAPAAVVDDEEETVDDDDDVWPQPQGDGWIDSRGFIFDSRVHGMSANGVPAVNKHGAFRKLRNCDPDLYAQVEKAQADRVAGTPVDQSDAAGDAAGTSSSVAAAKPVVGAPSVEDVELMIRRATDMEMMADIEDVLQDLECSDDERLDLVAQYEDRLQRLAALIQPE